MAPLLGGSALHSEEIVVNLTREPASSAPVVIASASPMIAKPASSAPVIAKPASSAPVIAKPASSAPVIAKPASSAPVIASALPMARATPLDTIVAPPEAPLRARPVETMIPSSPSSASRPVSDEMRREILRRAFERKPVFEERVQPAKTPEWQKAYTLGAGDVLNLALFKRPDLARSGIVVAPDGTVSYLQAIGIQAAGRTVDELRKDIEISLAEYHEDPRVVVSPASMGSKRYTIIGRVREPGSFALTRPTTVLEALATAQGVEVGSVGSTNVEIADMERSFVSRGGQNWMWISRNSTARVISIRMPSCSPMTTFSSPPP
ncbi:MAG: polysaccharide biosynthesis/export family protein [Verrucomicrobiales bacterium]